MFVRSLAVRTLLALAVAATFATTHSVVAHAANWKELSPITSPSARSYPAMAYDPVSKKVVLFGGAGVNAFLNDTWTFDGTTWTQVNTPVAPPRRSAPSMAFDSTSQKLVLFGGFSGTGYLRDTWLWDGATSTWTRVRMKPAPPAASGPMLFNDPQTGQVLMFGGFNAGKMIPNFSATWSWTGITWAKLHPTTFPYGRGWGVAVLDPVRENVVVTGGVGDTIRTDNTWTWTNNDWTQQFPLTQVVSLVGPGSAFDVELQEVIVFGGFSQGSAQDVNETWSWTGADWVQLNPNRSPSAREGLGMAYYPMTHQVIVFGGENVNTDQLLGDTWAFAGR